MTELLITDNVGILFWIAPSPVFSVTWLQSVVSDLLRQIILLHCFQFVLYFFFLLNKAFQEGNKEKLLCIFQLLCIVKWVANLLFYSSVLIHLGFFFLPHFVALYHFYRVVKIACPSRISKQARGMHVSMHLFRRSQCFLDAPQVEQNPENRTISVTSNIIPGYVWADCCVEP